MLDRNLATKIQHAVDTQFDEQIAFTGELVKFPSVRGAELKEVISTATTDARIFDIYGKIPALVYGPLAEDIHGLNERVELDSVRRVTQTMTLFVAEWCGIEAL